MVVICKPVVKHCRHGGEAREGRGGNGKVVKSEEGRCLCSSSSRERRIQGSPELIKDCWVRTEALSGFRRTLLRSREVDKIDRRTLSSGVFFFFFFVFVVFFFF